MYDLLPHEEWTAEVKWYKTPRVWKPRQAFNSFDYCSAYADHVMFLCERDCITTEKAAQLTGLRHSAVIDCLCDYYEHYWYGFEMSDFKRIK